MISRFLATTLSLGLAFMLQSCSGGTQEQAPSIPQDALVEAYNASVDASSLPQATKDKLKADVASGATVLTTHHNGGQADVAGAEEPQDLGTGGTYVDAATTKPTITVNEDWVDDCAGGKNHPNHGKKRKAWLKKLYRHEIYHLAGTGPGGVGSVGETSCAHVGLRLQDMEWYCQDAAAAQAAGHEIAAENLCLYAESSLESAEALAEKLGCSGSAGDSGPPSFGWGASDLEICAFCAGGA